MMSLLQILKGGKMLRSYYRCTVGMSTRGHELCILIEYVSDGRWLFLKILWQRCKASKRIDSQENEQLDMVYTGTHDHEQGL